jgi:hypothetical protein
MVMAKVFTGRYSGTIDGSFVVFLIGMRVNRILALSKWVPVARAMGPMLSELYANRNTGFLHAETMLTWRGVALVQYWKSFEQLHAYAHARDAKHLPAWAAFNRSVGSDGSVGIWHETYQVTAGSYESIYANMPRWGLAAAGEQVEAVGRMKDARSRVGAAGLEK